MILTVETRAPDIGYQNRQRKHATITVYSDALLFTKPNFHGYGYESNMATIHAMSLIGPEQSIRAIAAGCSMQHDYQRTILAFMGTNANVIVGKWSGAWRHRTVRLTGDTLHMVAMPDVTVAQTAEADNSHSFKQVVIGHSDAPNLARDLRRQLYSRLMLLYPTPLVPIDQPGQNDAERDLGEKWCYTLTMNIMAETSQWRELLSHPDQDDETWASAGLLTLSRGMLDGIVSKLVANGSLPFPPQSTPHPETQPARETSLSA